MVAREIGGCKERTGHLMGQFERSSFLLPRSRQYRFAPGTTAVLSETVMPLTLELLEETVQDMDVE